MLVSKEIYWTLHTCWLTFLLSIELTTTAGWIITVSFGGYLKPIEQAVRQHIFLIDDHHGSPMRAVTHVIKKIMESSSCEAILLNQLLDLDCSLQKWRYSHLKLVERTIGQKAGTGGSSGAAYLKTTLFTPIFGELWDAIG